MGFFRAVGIVMGAVVGLVLGILASAVIIGIINELLR